MATLSVGGTTVFNGSALQSGVTLPAGHIITMGTLEPIGTSWNGVSGYTECTNYEISITKKQTATSKIVLNCSYPWNGYYDGDSGQAYQCSGYTKWVRDAPSAWTSPLFRQYWADELGSESHFNIYVQQSNGFVDTSTVAGVHTYTMWVNAADKTNNVTNQPGFIQIMEVTV